MLHQQGNLVSHFMYIYIYVRYIVDIDMDKLCIGDFSTCKSAPEMLQVTPVDTRPAFEVSYLPTHIQYHRPLISGLSVLSPWQTRAEQPSVRPSVRPGRVTGAPLLTPPPPYSTRRSDGLQKNHPKTPPNSSASCSANVLGEEKVG